MYDIVPLTHGENLKLVFFLTLHFAFTLMFIYCMCLSNLLTDHDKFMLIRLLYIHEKYYCLGTVLHHLNVTFSVQVTTE